jgi:hypothetical protein
MNSIRRFYWMYFCNMLCIDFILIENKCNKSGKQTMIQRYQSMNILQLWRTIEISWKLWFCSILFMTHCRRRCDLVRLASSECVTPCEIICWGIFSLLSLFQINTKGLMISPCCLSVFSTLIFVSRLMRPPFCLCLCFPLNFSSLCSQCLMKGK